MELVLNSYGTSLSRDNEGFVIGDASGLRRIPAEGVDSIRVARGAKITSDAILLALEREIEVLFMGRGGNVEGRVWSSRYGSISTIRKGQLQFAASKEAVDWIKGVISIKIENQQALLSMIRREDASESIDVRQAISRLEYAKIKVSELEAERVSDIASSLRGIEGAASKAFFEAYSLMLPEHHRFAARTQHPAYDLPNALLNYGYGMLYGKVEGALICAGIDPYIGVLHRDEYNRPVLVYDVIEKYRVWVEYVVFRILSQKSLSDDLCSVNEDGSVWLEGLGRRVIIQSMNDYLDEVITVGRLTRARSTIIDLYAQSLAQKFKQSK